MATDMLSCVSIPFFLDQGDVDFLLPQERFEEAASLMEKNGYLQFSEGKRHAEFMKDGVEFELHHHFSQEDLDIEE